MHIGIASDHAGFNVKLIIIEILQQKNLKYIDYGTYDFTSVDYPDYAHKLAKGLKKQEIYWGIALCNTGNGICMTLNRHPFIRAALCWTPQVAGLARAHNDANIMVLPAGFVDVKELPVFVDLFLKTPFEAGRHTNRINKINLII